MASHRLHRAVRDVARTIVPVACPGCGAEDLRVCDECAAPWWEAPWRVEADAGRLEIHGRVTLPVWAVATLAGPAHGLIGAWKDGGRRDLDRFFADAALRAGSALAAHLCDVARPVAVVPAPARAAGVRRRGMNLPHLLADGVAEGLARGGADAFVHRALAIGRGEQRLGNATDRWRGMHAAVRLTGPPPRGVPVLLVDDVVTTGATLAASTEALERAGSVVVGAFTLASVGHVAGGRTGV